MTLSGEKAGMDAKGLDWVGRPRDWVAGPFFSPLLMFPSLFAVYTS